MSQPSKIFKTHGEQIDLLRSRGMCIEDEAEARRILERVNYYRLSGYWYSYRQPPSDGSQRLDTFVEGTSFAEVVSLYEFEPATNAINRCFGQLTLIQYLLNELGVGDSTILPNILETYPAAKMVPQSHMGIPSSWETLPLWKH